MRPGKRYDSLEERAAINKFLAAGPRFFVAALCALALAPCVALAALSDEIQVYTDDINAPREFGLELHVNTTPSGRSVPDYPGEAAPAHGVRVTPEFSYGLTPAWEAGLYIPTNLDRSGSYQVAGAKLRLKWLPVRPAENSSGWFLGANGELSHVQKKFSESPSSFELRVMAGHRSEDWLFAMNPVFGWSLSSGYRAGTPDFALSFKAARTVREGLAVGLEHYAELGTTRKLLPSNEQQHTLYAALDLDTKLVAVNFGIGRGLNSTTDKWTVKAIFGFSF